MQFKRKKSKSSLGINFTPLIDVVFLLVVFFMLTTRFAVFEAIPLSISSSNNGGMVAAEGEGDIAIEVRKNTFLVNQQPTDKAGLKDFLSPRLQQNPERAVVIMPTEKASIQLLVDAVDTVRLAGGKNLAVMRVEE